MVQFGVESENGWRPAKAGDDILEWITVPGTNPPVRLQLMKGWPLQIMQAFAADYNANVEHLRDPDSAAFTPTNKVDTSNHLNGTAMDLNWNGADGHTFRLGISEAQAYPGEETTNLRALLDFYEGMIYCGGNWDIRDWMHFQMGGNTWNNPRTQDFINRKIRADGFSTYKRNATPPPQLPPQESYGVPPGSSINYGAPGFPDWVYQLGQKFNLRASTYPGHQETDRIEAGFARNPQHLNRGIDWAGPVNDMQRFAEYCLSIRGSLEQVIWQNPNTRQRVGVAGGKDVTNTGYYDADYGGHTDHVHTRQSAPIPQPGAPPPPPPANGATILALATSITIAKATEILPLVSFALRKGNCTNPRRIAAALAQWVIESGHFVYTEEIASGPETQERWKYKGRTWIQLTWLENYLGFSRWCHSLNLVPSPTYFGDHPRELANQKWAALGPAYWWAVKYPQINEYADRGDIDNVSKWVNAPAWVDNPNKHANGEAERRAVYNQALALGDQLLTLIGTQPLPGEDDFLSALTPEEQRALYNAIMLPRVSKSPFRPPGQGPIGSLMEYVQWIDGNEHFQSVVEGARLGHPGSLELLSKVAEVNLVQYPDREKDRELARNVLNEIAVPTTPPTPSVTTVAVTRELPPVVHTEPEVLPAVMPEHHYVEPPPFNPVTDIKISNPPPNNTPDELLNTLDRLSTFDREYRQKFENLTKETEEPK